MKKTIHLLIKKPDAIDREVRTIVNSMFTDFDFSGYDKALADVGKLFAGKMHGFEQCDTDYHDYPHTMGALLATARLLHGIHVDRQALSPRIVQLALMAAMFHDAGYIRRIGENGGTGAQFTKGHVQRSVDLFEDWADRHGWSIDDIMDVESMIQCTDPANSPDTIVFTNIETMLAGHVLGTADLMAQMADDIYLEKLPFLFDEFIEGGITDFSSEYDLFRKTMGFYSFMRSKMENRLSNVIAYMSTHFRERHGVERDFYSEAAQRNMDYLTFILKKHGKEYQQGLRRSLVRKEYPIQIAA